MKYSAVYDEEEELAKAEPPIGEKELLQEILPLMQEYFVGEFELDEKFILYRMPNGQRFLITVREE